MAIVTEIPWDAVAEPTFGADRVAWREAVAQIASKAKEKLPDCNGRIEKAVALVLAGDVQLQDDGSATVGGSQAGDVTYTVAQGVCACKDYPRAPHSFCKHRLASAIARRALALTIPPAPANDQPAPTPGPDVRTPALLPESLLPYVVHIKGKAFIQYGGLLTLAQSRGLISLKVDFISVTSELALARAEAIFADGRVYVECADATPGNVGAQVRPHFPRLALTRAKARTLRDALGITMVALEELGGED